MSTLFAPERWEKIGEIVDRNGRATVEELAQLLDVSSATVRRDLQEMQHRGMVARARGGAIRAEKVAMDLSLSENMKLCTPEKEKIARLVAGLVEPDDTIMMNGGSTSYQVALHLSGRHITVVTHGINIVQALLDKPEVEIVVVGGTLRRRDQSCIGPSTEREFARLFADKTILGIHAISVARGLSTPTAYIAEIDRMMLERSRETIVAADHTKLDKVALYQVAPIEAVTKLVTDSGATEEQIAPFIEAGVEVLIAE